MSIDPTTLVILSAILLVFVSLLLAVALRYKKCPSDQILVVYGKVGREKSAKCIHGGAQFIIPFFQDYKFLSLRPMQIDINLQGALSQQNIRINTPSTYTIGISVEEGVMRNAAERLLSMTHKDIETTAREIIFGQQRLVIASMDIEEINSNRDLFLQKIKDNVESELNKIGLRLINVNITDITDEEGYLEALGKKAASEVTNRAKVQVAEQDKVGAMGVAIAEKERRISISMAEAEASKGEADASRIRRLAIADSETTAVKGESLLRAEAAKGEAEAQKIQRLAVAESETEAVKGESLLKKDQRISIKEADALAIQGENESAIRIARSEADRRVVEEETRQKIEQAKVQADAHIQGANYDADKLVQIKKAEMVREREIVEKIIPAEISKKEKEIRANAEAEIVRLKAKGDADAKLLEMEALAKGQYDMLKAKADGFADIIKACGNDPDAASKMLMIEKMEAMVNAQVEAIKNIKIDKVVVWDNLGGGKSSTAQFLSGMAGALPPLHDIAKSAGIELPNFMGKMSEEIEQKAESLLAEKNAKAEADKGEL